MMTGWLGVAPAERVWRGVNSGTAEISTVKRSRLARMRVGDTVIYYSPRASVGYDGSVLQSFTAIGTVADDELWQAEEGAFKPYHRRVHYVVDARITPIVELKASLDFTANLTSRSGWSCRLRWGLAELTPHDVGVIREAMCTGGPEPNRVAALPVEVLSA